MRSCFILLAAFLCGGCATIVTGGGHTQNVRFTSEPIGATVYVDNNKIGLTPIAAPLTRADNHVVRMELAGDTQTRDVKHTFNGWIFGNIVFGGLIGVVVDASSGTMDGVLAPGSVTFKFAPPAPPSP